MEKDAIMKKMAVTKMFTMAKFTMSVLKFAPISEDEVLEYAMSTHGANRMEANSIISQ